MMSSITKDVVIKNITGEDLKDVYLTYEGLEKHPFKIANIRKNGQVLVSLFLNHLRKPTELKLFYFINDEKNEMIVYDNLDKDDLSRLTLTISIIDDKLHIETTH